MEDDADNGMIIYIIITEKIIAAEFSIDNFNYISLYFSVTVKKYSLRSFQCSLLSRYSMKSFLRFLKAISTYQYVI